MFWSSGINDVFDNIIRVISAYALVSVSGVASSLTFMNSFNNTAVFPIEAVLLKGRFCLLRLIQQGSRGLMKQIAISQIQFFCTAWKGVLHKCDKRKP